MNVNCEEWTTSFSLLRSLIAPVKIEKKENERKMSWGFSWLSHFAADIFYSCSSSKAIWTYISVLSPFLFLLILYISQKFWKRATTNQPTLSYSTRAKISSFIPTLLLLDIFTIWIAGRVEREKEKGKEL